MLKLDKLLRLQRFDRSSDIVRMKAIIVTTIAFMCVLFVSLISYVSVFQVWDLYVTLAVVSVVVTILLLLSFRYHKKYALGAIGLSLIISGAIVIGASIQTAGLDSALLPFLPLTIIASGFISGWRTTGLSALIAFCAVGLLFYQSASTIGDGSLIGAIENKLIFNKLLQLSLACLMAVLISTNLSLAMHGLFRKDANSVDKVQQVERQRTAFLSSLSHEIRTPLNGIVGMSKLLSKTQLTAQQSQYANIVTKCSDDLMEVMSTVMEFSQVKNQRIALKSEFFDIHKLAHDLVQKHAARLAQKPDVILGLHIAPAVPQVLFSDEKRIEIVINHLLRNAIHFTPEGSVNLLLDGQVEGEDLFKLRVYVRDTGAGIRKDDLEDIYKPFHQLDSRLTREHEGTGLGLSLCKEIIGFMNGKIDVVSEFGTGSTFFFEVTIPMKDRRKSIIDNPSLQIAEANDLTNVAIFRKTG